MSEKLEKLARNNQDKFDQIEPVDTDKIWMGINQYLDHHPRQNIINIWFVVAAAIIVLLAMSTIYLSIRVEQQGALNSEEFLSQIYPEFSDEFKDLNQQVSARKAAISFDTIHSEEFPDLFREMKILDTNYHSAIDDLKNIGKEDAILRVLIRYHQRQIDLLERLSNEIEKKKMYHEKNNLHILY